MKCPKCGYLGFEDVDRCRNCGYDFSLIQPDTLPELSLRGDHEELSPLDDLALVDAAAPSYTPEGSGPALTNPDRGLNSSPPQPPTAELPLFGPSATALTDDVPLITRAAPPRAPLAVRRATLEVPRLRSSSRLRTPMLDLNTFETAPITASSRRPPAASRAAIAIDGSAEPAGISARVGAALVDLVILAAIDIVVVYLTMQISGITMADLSVLPEGPLVAFLAVQNLGYVIGLTLAGQTLGKMAAGIKVVSAQDDASPDFGHSALRALVWVALAVPAGLGFLTALFDREHRGLHDRCAGTKVVRATT